MLRLIAYSYPRFTSIKLGKFLLFSLTVVWLSLGFHLLITIFSNNFESDKALISLSLDDKRALVTGKDFYGFIKSCESAIPPDQSLGGIFGGRDIDEKKFYYYRSYYFLYPRNFTKDADYFILYNLPLEQAPDGYQLIAQFGKNKSILKKQAQ